MKTLIPALIKAKASFNPIKKDAVNPHYKNQYATMDAILGAVEPALIANGLTIVQTTDVLDNARQVLVTQLFHESGESIKGIYLLPDNGDPQKMGSAITYARRYALCAILSVVADQDDDGQAASKGQQRSTAQTPKPSPQEPATTTGSRVITPAQIGRLTTIAKSAGYTDEGLKALVFEYKFKTRKDITVDVYDALCEEAGNPDLALAYNTKAEEEAAA